MPPLLPREPSLAERQSSRRRRLQQLFIRLHEARGAKRAPGRSREAGEPGLIWILLPLWTGEPERASPSALGRRAIEVIMLKLSLVQFLLGQARN